MLIIDEVQSGFGRCGSYFAIETIAPGLKPDIMIMAKGIANVSRKKDFSLALAKTSLPLFLLGFPTIGHRYAERTC